MQTHLVPKIMHQNFAVILQQFNFSKNSFIVLVALFYLKINQGSGLVGALQSMVNRPASLSSLILKRIFL